MKYTNVLHIPFEELELGVRAYNICKRHGIYTLGDVLNITLYDAIAWAELDHTLGYEATMQIIDAQNHIRSLI